MYSFRTGELWRTRYQLFGLCVSFSVLSLYSPVLSDYHLLFLLTLCLSHIFLPTTSEVVDFLRHWPCGVGGKNIQEDIIGENGDIYLKTPMTKGWYYFGSTKDGLLMVVFKCHQGAQSQIGTMKQGRRPPWALKPRGVHSLRRHPLTELSSPVTGQLGRWWAPRHQK